MDRAPSLVSVDESPLHGFQGERRPAEKAVVPLAASIAISREVGARGGEIARRLAAKLGWQVFDREMLEYASQDPSACESMLAELPHEASNWIDGRLRFLHQHNVLSTEDSFERVAQLVLTLGAKGEGIFVGRGAGFILPRETTLHVRLIAPLPDRVSYFSQWLRLPPDEAAEQVRVRSEKRNAFLAACFHLPSDGIIYDIVLNTSALGEELSADLIIQALRCKQSAPLEPDELDA